MTVLTAVLATISALYCLLRSEWFTGCGFNGKFCPDVCQRLDSTLEATIVGQELALEQISAVVCEHVRKRVRRSAAAPLWSWQTCWKRQDCAASRLRMQAPPQHYNRFPGPREKSGRPCSACPAQLSRSHEIAAIALMTLAPCLVLRASVQNE